MRNERIDNLKGILMVLVVFGHFLELIMDQGWTKYVYELIYSFHMPFFVFISGYFYKFNFEKIIRNLLFPYIVFQVLYILFARLVLKDFQILQFYSPYWLLWYLFAMILWSFMILLFPRGKIVKDFISLFIAFLICLAAGLTNNFGREFSLSRILVFFPFFLLGNCYSGWKKKSIGQAWQNKFYKIQKIIAFIAILVIIPYSFIMLRLYTGIKNTWFYEALCYEKDGSGITFRMIHILIALCVILIGITFMPNKKIRFLSKAGENTMQVYLLHGFIIKGIQKSGIIKRLPLQGVVIILLTFLIVMALSSDKIQKIFSIFRKGSSYDKKKNISNCT